MVTFINKPASTSERFAKAFANAGYAASQEIPEHFQKKEKKKIEDEKEIAKRNALKKLLGEDYSDLPPDIQKSYVDRLTKESEASKRFSHEKELQGLKFAHENDISKLENASKTAKLAGEETTKRNEKIVPFQSGLQTLKRMREIGSLGRLGRGSSLLGLAGGETARDRAEYTQLGKSLISLASNIPIRNQKEFETLAHDLYDPSLSDSAREGILNAMERIITQSMEQYTNQEATPQKSTPKIEPTQKERPPLSSFHR